MGSNIISRTGCCFSRYSWDRASGKTVPGGVAGTGGSVKVQGFLYYCDTVSGDLDRKENPNI